MLKQYYPRAYKGESAVLEAQDGNDLDPEPVYLVRDVAELLNQIKGHLFRATVMQGGDPRYANLAIMLVIDKSGVDIPALSKAFDGGLGKLEAELARTLPACENPDHLVTCTCAADGRRRREESK